jgi:hypothetical protein
VAGLAGPVAANEIAGLGDLPPNFAPRLAKIAAAGRVHFVKEGEGCPAAAPACADGAYLVAGDDVVVLATKADYADAVFTGGAPRFRSTRGWLPQSALTLQPAPAPTVAAWVGEWHNGTNDIAIKPATGGRLDISGTATWGGDDPVRRAAGGVNVGEFDTSLLPTGSVVTFSPSGDGDPATLDPPLDGDDCVLRLWLLGPYLLAADNGRCGGMNVSFSNLYRRAEPKR